MGVSQGVIRANALKLIIGIEGVEIIKGQGCTTQTKKPAKGDFLLPLIQVELRAPFVVRQNHENIVIIKKIKAIGLQSQTSVDQKWYMLE